jgi:hypothetical protein
MKAVFICPIGHFGLMVAGLTETSLLSWVVASFAFLCVLPEPKLLDTIYVEVKYARIEGICRK